MGVERQAVGEADEQVLSARLDVVDAVANDSLELGATGPAASRGHLLAGQRHTKDLRYTSKRVALRHRSGLEQPAPIRPLEAGVGEQLPARRLGNRDAVDALDLE